MRNKHVKRLITVGLLSLLILSLGTVATAQKPPTDPFSNLEGMTHIGNLSDLKVDPSLVGASGPVRVIVELAQAPAVTVTDQPSAASGAIASVSAGQQGVIATAQSLGATITGSTAYLFNGVFMQIDASQLAALAASPNVVAIYPDHEMVRDDTVSTALIGAPAAWDGGLLGGSYTGRNMVISIVDSGIDYTHTHVGGPGNYAASGDPTILDSLNLFPAAYPLPHVGAPKVIGGYDYVGDAYTGSNTPVPDPDPIDCPIELGGGHGSHVAGSAAGWGVTSIGDTYPGPYNAAIFPSYPNWTAGFRIGPGVAPEAALIAMKVFGCDGSTATSIIISAIEDSVTGARSNGVQADVVNLSLGAAWGNGQASSPYNTTITNANVAGTAIVISAGNSSDYFYITGAPSTSPAAISIASSVDAVNYARAIRQNPATLYGAAYGAFGPFIHAPVTAAGQLPPGNVEGCTPAAFAGFTPGNIAVVSRGTCPFVDKANSAFGAGAVGLIVYNNQPGASLTMGGDPVAGYNIPSVFISQADGTALAANLSSITMDIGLALQVNEQTDTISSFTSRGPSRGNTVSFKPDLAAPGNTILSMGSGTGTGTYNISGTSMAAPHAAGAVALLMQKYPAWPLVDIKALIMNTANANLTTSGGTLYGPQRVGSGRLNLNDALTSRVVAYNSASPSGVNISFGYPQVVAGQPLNLTRTVTLRNNGAQTAIYNVSVSQRSNMPGIQFVPASTSVTVGPFSTTNLNVSLVGDMNVAGVGAVSDPTLARNGHFMMEESAILTFTPAGHPNGPGATTPLRVPLYVAPRPVSDLASSEQITIVDPTQPGVTALGISGTPLSTGPALPNDLVSVATVFEAIVGNRPNNPAAVDAASIQHFGITNDYNTASNLANSYTYFAFATHGNWNTPNETSLGVAIDLDRNGSVDFGFAHTNWAITGYTYDVFRVLFIDYAGVFGAGPGALFLGDPVNALSANIINTYLYNTNVMVLPAFTGDLQDFLGLADLSFDYYIDTGSVLGPYDGPGELIGPFTYNPSNVPFSFNDSSGVAGGPYSGLPAWLTPSTNNYLPLDYNLAAWGGGPYPSALVLHHHNGVGARAELVPVKVQQTYDSLALFDSTSNTVSLTRSLGSNIPGYNHISYTLNAPAVGDVLMGDWNGDGRETPGVFNAGAFHFTNQISPSATWQSVWIGPSGRAISGFFDPNVPRECPGVLEEASLGGYVVFVLWYTCDLSVVTPAIQFQWISAVLPDQAGFTGVHQFAAGDWNGNGIDTIAARRSDFIAYTNVGPTQGHALYDLAQYWGTPAAGVSTAYGIFVSGDWNGDGNRTFGVYYEDTGYLFAKNNVAWNAGVHESTQFNVSFTVNDVAAWRPGGNYPSGTIVAGEPLETGLASLDGLQELEPLELVAPSDLIGLDLEGNTRPDVNDDGVAPEPEDLGPISDLD